MLFNPISNIDDQLSLKLGDARRWHHVQMEIQLQISLKLVSDNWFPINFS